MSAVDDKRQDETTGLAFRVSRRVFRGCGLAGFVGLILSLLSFDQATQLMVAGLIIAVSAFLPQLNTPAELKVHKN